MRLTVELDEGLLSEAMRLVPSISTKKGVIEFALYVLVQKDMRNLVLKKIQSMNDELIEPLNISSYPICEGRPRVLNDAQVIQVMIWKSEGLSNCEIARRLSVSESTIRRYLRELNSLND